MLDIPDNAEEVVARSKADVQRELNTSNPFGKNHWLGAIITASGNRDFDLYLQLGFAIRESLPDTATLQTEDNPGGLLTRWAAIWGKQQQAASKSNGNIVATGVAGSTISDATIFVASGVGNFLSTSSATVSDQTINIDDLTRAGTTVTAKTPSSHGLANGVSVTIAAASNTEYNTTADVTVISADEFQYEIIGSPPNEIGTSATASFTTASIPVQSEDFGADVNLDAGTQLKPQSPIIGVDDTLVVDFGAVGGGTDQESGAALRNRTLDRIQNPVAHFNVSDIVEIAKEVEGVTRVFVQEVTPALGQVTIYFMRDNDIDPIPTGSEVVKVKDIILTIKPANTATADVIVLSPTGVPVDFTFTSVDPNTASMQSAVNANLRQFFDESTEIGVDVAEDAYRSAIFNTVDTVTGERIKTFTLSTPSGDVTISSGEIGTLGNVVYP